MGEDTSAKVVAADADRIKRLSVRESRFPAWLFQGRELTLPDESSQTIEQDVLINTLNRLHFVDEAILVHLFHPRYEENILVRAYPEPCAGSEFSCSQQRKKASKRSGAGITHTYKASAASSSIQSAKPGKPVSTSTDRKELCATYS